MSNPTDIYLIELTKQTSYSDESKKIIISKIPGLSPENKIKLKINLLQAILLLSAKQTLEAIPEKKGFSSHVSELGEIDKQILLKAASRESEAASHADAHIVSDSLLKNTSQT